MDIVIRIVGGWVSRTYAYRCGDPYTKDASIWGSTLDPVIMETSYHFLVMQTRDS